MNRINQLLLTVLLGMLASLLPTASAQTDLQALDALATGTEVLVLDGTGASLIGHGVVNDGLLRLRLVRGSGDFVMLIARQDGSILQYQGIMLADGRLRVVLDDGTRLDIDELLERMGTRYARVFDNGNVEPATSITSPPSASEPPGSPPPPRGDDDDDDDGDDDDDDDDDRDDDDSDDYDDDD